jgi:hypothetical protein
MGQIEDPLDADPVWQIANESHEITSENMAERSGRMGSRAGVGQWQAWPDAVV